MRYSVGRTWKLVFKMLRAIVKVQVGFSVFSKKALDVIAPAVNVIIIWISFESEETTFLDVIALAVNVIIIYY